MPKFGKKSSVELSTCHPTLQKLFNKVVKTYDCAVRCGYRGQVDQDEAYVQGRSSVKYPDGKHNRIPSLAVDVYPYPVVLPDKKKRPETYVKDLARYYHFAGYVTGVAENMGVKVRWGGDWDKDFDLLDQTFDDLVHWEIV